MQLEVTSHLCLGYSSGLINIAVQLLTPFLYFVLLGMTWVLRYSVLRILAYRRGAAEAGQDEGVRATRSAAHHERKMSCENSVHVNDLARPLLVDVPDPEPGLELHALSLAGSAHGGVMDGHAGGQLQRTPAASVRASLSPRQLDSPASPIDLHPSPPSRFRNFLSHLGPTPLSETTTDGGSGVSLTPPDAPGLGDMAEGSSPARVQYRLHHLSPADKAKLKLLRRHHMFRRALYLLCVFSYEALTEQALQIFNCVTVCHYGQVLADFPQIHCDESQAYVAFRLFAILILCFTVAFPVGLVIWWYRNRCRFHEIDFRARYDVLYGDYVPAKQWWLAQELARRAVSVAVYVGLFLNLGMRQYILAVVCLIFLVFHMVCLPLKSALDNFLETLSLGVLSYVAVTVASEGVSQNAVDGMHDFVIVVLAILTACAVAEGLHLAHQFIRMRHHRRAVWEQAHSSESSQNRSPFRRNVDAQAADTELPDCLRPVPMWGCSEMGLDEDEVDDWMEDYVIVR